MATRKSVADDLHDENSAAYRRGMAELHKQLGPMADAYIQRIKRLAPEFAWVNVTFPFGELYTRDAVDLKTRELCTVAALTCRVSPSRNSKSISTRRCAPAPHALRWLRS